MNAQLRKIIKNRGHFPDDDAAVNLLWLAIINIEDKRARERIARKNETGKRSDQPARLVEGQRVMGWRQALNELDTAYPGQIRETTHTGKQKKILHTLGYKLRAVEVTVLRGK
jgi:putative transposase